MKATTNKKSALRRRKKKLSLIAVIGIILSLVIVVGGASAYLQKQTDAVTNSFTAATAPTPEIVEDFDGDVKENVKVKLSNKDGESGSYYVRAAVVFSLQDDANPPNTVANVPIEGTDYKIEYGSDWTLGDDGYWYYSSTVVPGGLTSNLIESCTTLNTEYKLVVDILAQTVQANPELAASEAWGYPSDPSASN